MWYIRSKVRSITRAQCSKTFPPATKLFILCATFLISIAVPIYGLVTEKRIAIDFSRKELLGSQYLGTLREIYAAVLADGLDGQACAR